MKKTNGIQLYIGLVISLFNLMLFLLMRPVWLFVDNTIPLPGQFPLSFTELFAVIMTVFSLFFIILLMLRSMSVNVVRPTPLKVISWILLVMEAIFTGLNFYLYQQMGNSRSEVYRGIVFSLPYVVPVTMLLYFILLHPRWRISRNKAFQSGMTACLVIVVLLMICHTGQVRITSGPVLQSVGPDTLAVIWTTNVAATTQVMYGPDKEHMQTAYSIEDGLLQSDTKLHKVLIDVAGMDSLVYQVVSTKINHIFQNDTDYGNTVKGALVSYQKPSMDTSSFYVLNDIHDHEEIYRDFLSGKDYDFVVTNGDTLEVTDSFSVVRDNFLSPLAKYTGGSHLSYFVRGNHETRGREARRLKNYLGLPDNRYYYTFKTGPVYAIVLDSGEDKLDNHREYSGLVDFEHYKSEETAWLADVLDSEEFQSAKFKVVFIHMPLNSYEDQTEADYLKSYEDTWRSMLSEAGIDVAFSGHTHEPLLLKTSDYEASFPTVIGGGEASDEAGYRAVRVEATEQLMTVYYEDSNGNTERILRIMPD